jgi:hypothetical protein
MEHQEERLSDYANLPAHHRLAMAFDALSGASSSLALLNRYQSRLHHEYHRLLKTLLQMQSAHAEQSPTAKFPNEPNPVFEQSVRTNNQQPATNNGSPNVI